MLQLVLLHLLNPEFGMQPLLHPVVPTGALTDSAMLTFILRRVRASTVMLAPFEKLQRRLLKAALGLFGSADNAPRVQVRWWVMPAQQPRSVSIFALVARFQERFKSFCPSSGHRIKTHALSICRRPCCWCVRWRWSCRSQH